MIKRFNSNSIAKIVAERFQMNVGKKMVLEAIRYLIKNNPDLAPRIEKMVQDLQEKNRVDINLLLTLNKDMLTKSKSQLRQDIFVLSELGFKRSGFFVEFGATNGIDLSNSYLLETEYDWDGILAEPAKIWHSELINNRKVTIDKRCIWKTSKEKLIFNETNWSELSTVDSLSDSDHHSEDRKGGKKYSVDTVSLMDLLEDHNAPKEIDYLSVDTEGSEYDILENFDFQKYKFNVITCEHNYSPMRDRLFALFQKNGFKRKYEHISQFDDWYVRA